MTLGKNIKIARLQKDMTQNELAGKLGITQAQLSLYERDIRRPPDKHKVQLADILDKSIDDLFYPNDYIDQVLSQRFNNVEEGDELER